MVFNKFEAGTAFTEAADVVDTNPNLNIRGTIAAHRIGEAALIEELRAIQRVVRYEALSGTDKLALIEGNMVPRAVIAAVGLEGTRDLFPLARAAEDQQTVEALIAERAPLYYPDNLQPESFTAGTAMYIELDMEPDTEFFSTNNQPVPVSADANELVSA